MARQPGPTAREIESSQLVDVIAKPSRVDDIAPDFSRLCTGQKPVAVFLNDFFCGTVPANLERIAPARWTIDAAESNRAIFSDDPQREAMGHGDKRNVRFQPLPCVARHGGKG